jgi:hypothetical protein
MIESSMFTCPDVVGEEGTVTCERMRQALELLQTNAIGTPAERYIMPLEALLDCHEASLWAAVDFHGLQHLDDHYMSCCRTEALLGGVLDDIELPRAEDTELLRRLLNEAAAAARAGGRPCRVSRPGVHLGLPRNSAWEDAVNGVDREEEDASP